MQAKEADYLRRNWDGKKCEHLQIDKEYDLGADTGDYVCTKCGEIFDRKEKEEIEKNRE